VTWLAPTGHTGRLTEYNLKAYNLADLSEEPVTAHFNDTSILSGAHMYM